MASFKVIADNGKQIIVDKVFTEYGSAYVTAVMLSKQYFYVELYKNNRLIEEYGPNENFAVD